MWIDIEAPTTEKLKKIGEQFGIPQRILREGQAHSLGQGFVRHRDHENISVRILELGDDRDSGRTQQAPLLGEPDELNIIVYRNMVLTVHERTITAMSEVRRRYETGDTPLESHEGPGSVVATILQECAQENISKLDLLEESLATFGKAVERKLFGLNELGALYGLRKSFKAARDLLRREEVIPTELEACATLFAGAEPQSVCQRYRNKLESARDKASMQFDDANDMISRNSSRLGARAATGAVAALFVSLSQGLVQSLADGAFEPSRAVAGTVLALGVFGAIIALGRGFRRGQW